MVVFAVIFVGFVVAVVDYIQVKEEKEGYY